MQKLYLDQQRFLAYHSCNLQKRKEPCIIFHHGLMSDMSGKKALYLEQYCQEQKLGFVRFDNFGHGRSSGKFTEQTISTWLEGLMAIIDMVGSSVILVGSSMGGWVSTLAAMRCPQVTGLITISAAPDFTSKLMWDQLSPCQQKLLQQQKIINITGDDNCHNYPISWQLIEDGKQHLLLNSAEKITLNCPVILLHGSADRDVPVSFSESLFQRLEGDYITLKILKDADHRFSRILELQAISHSVQELCHILKHQH